MRSLAAIMRCDFHPISNRRILEYLRKTFCANAAAQNAWCGTWMAAGFNGYESLLVADGRRVRFSFCDRRTLTDVYLIPQIESSRRFGVDVAQCESDPRRRSSLCRNRRLSFGRAWLAVRGRFDVSRRPTARVFRSPGD